MIVVLELENVVIDGVPSGSVCDVLFNHDPRDERGFRSELLTALQTWSDSRVQEHHAECQAICDAHAADDEAKAAAHKAALAAKDEEHQSALVRLQAEHQSAMSNLRAQADEAMAKWETDITAARSANAELQIQINALGGTELGQRLAREAKVKEAQDTIAKAQAALAALGQGGQS